MGRGDEIDTEDLPEKIRYNLRGPRSGGGHPAHELFRPGRVPRLEEVECVAVEHALNQVGWNKTRAADLLGISRQTLRAKIKDYGLAAAEEGEPAATS